MKNITIITTLVLSLIVAGCDKPVDAVASPESAKETLIGTWSATFSEKDDEVDNVTYYKITRRSDASVTLQEIYIDHITKEYAIDESNGSWGIEGTYYIEKYPHYNEPDYFKIISITKEEFTYYVLEDAESKVATHEIPIEEIDRDLRESAQYSLPKPPEGYSKSKD